MAHSIELLPDDDTRDFFVRRWAELDRVGLPHAGRIRADTNRPHCTLVAARRIDSGADTALAVITRRLPVTARLGPPAVFPVRGRYVLAAAVVPDRELLALHASAAAAAADYIAECFAHTRPGSWTPHLTLARRLTGPQLVQALELLPWPDREIEFTTVRRWDGDTKTEVVLPGPA